MQGANAIYNNPEWIGKKFGRLTVADIIRVKSEKQGSHWEWKCKCDCGRNITVVPNSIVKGKNRSCGCLSRERLVEYSKSREHKYKTSENKKLWWKYSTIKRRCYNKDFARYEDYGGRGIKMCDEWLQNFDNFVEWAYANGYKDGLTIERRDVNGDYCPENCTFITLEEQARNKRNTIWVTYNGERIQLKKLCERENVNYHMIKYRIKEMGWPIEKAISEPSSKDMITLADKCRPYNIPRKIVYDRINKLGWDEERALTTPVRHCKKRDNDK